MSTVLATYNINGIRKRLPILLQWLEKAAPDIVCLQELKAADNEFPVDELRAAGYGSLWFGQRTWNGVAILARGSTPLESRRGLPGDPSDTQSRYLEAAVHGVLVGCLYLLLDFNAIEDGVRTGAPRKTAWLAAFGLTLTLVWIYLEMLRFLSRFYSRN